MSASHRRSIAWTLAVCAALATGCSSLSTGTPVNESASTAGANPQAALRAWAMYSADEAPISSPREYAEYSQLIATGTVQEFVDGRIFFAESLEDPEGIPNLVMRVHVDDYIKGEPAPDDLIYVELPRVVSVEEVNEAIPAHTKVAIYLESAPIESERFIVGNDNAGFPQGEKLWRPVGTEALILETETGGLVFPLGHTVKKDGVLQSQLPD